MANVRLVGEYERRLARVAARLAHQIDPDDGFGLTATQGSSLVNTAEALMILRKAHARGIPVDDKVVRRSISYLSRNVAAHCQPRDATQRGRGAKTRFVSFTLLGLTAWPSLLDDSTMRTIRWSVRWLRDASLSDGLPEERGGQDLSLFQNALAISALCRTLDVPGLDRTTRRTALTILDQTLHGSLYFALPNCTWPWRSYGSRASPAITGLSIIALADAEIIGHLPEEVTIGRVSKPRTVRSSELLQSSASWLTSSARVWRQRIEMDPDVTGTQWHHLTYGICMEAVALAGDPLAEGVIEGWRDLLGLWDRSRRGWTEPTNPRVATVRADYVAVRAIEALLTNVGTRGAEVLDERLRSEVSQVAAEFAALACGPLSQHSVICEDGSDPIKLQLSPAFERMLAAVLQLGGASEYVSREVLAAELGYSENSIGTYVKRLNAQVMEQTCQSYPLLTRSRGAAKGSGYRLNIRTLIESPA